MPKKKVKRVSKIRVRKPRARKIKPIMPLAGAAVTKVKVVKKKKDTTFIAEQVVSISVFPKPTATRRDGTRSISRREIESISKPKPDYTKISTPTYVTTTTSTPSDILARKLLEKQLQDIERRLKVVTEAKPKAEPEKVEEKAEPEKPEKVEEKPVEPEPKGKEPAVPKIPHVGTVRVRGKKIPNPLFGLDIEKVKRDGEALMAPGGQPRRKRGSSKILSSVGIFEEVEFDIVQSGKPVLHRGIQTYIFGGTAPRILFYIVHDDESEAVIKKMLAALAKDEYSFLRTRTLYAALDALGPMILRVLYTILLDRKTEDAAATTIGEKDAARIEAVEKIQELIHILRTQ